MRVLVENGLYHIAFTNRHGKQSCSNIDYLKNIVGWESFTTHMINYSSGKQPSTIASWLSRIHSTLKPLIIDTGLTSIPKSSSEWQLFIKNLYASTLVTANIRANILTRVKIWNNNTRPFLVYMQQRDYIPIDVLIPRMKRVGQKVPHSSFKVRVLGEKKPSKITQVKKFDKLLCPVSLSRTDSEYLDELYYDLELKRNKLHASLVEYWITIKEHFDYANQLVELFDKENYEQRIKSKDYYNYYQTKTSGPPRRRHFLAEKNKDSFSCLLYRLKHLKKPFILRTCGSHNCLPNKSSIANNKDYYYSLLPKCKIEDTTTYSLSNRLNWCLGLLTSRCISFLIALLMMENPKFTYESLLFSDLADGHNKTWLESGITPKYAIKKYRANCYKSSKLSDISKDILSHLAYVNFNFNKEINQHSKKKIFVCLKQGEELSIPDPKSMILFLNGSYDVDKNDKKSIYNIFPSLQSYGLIKSSISYKKIRNTEGVLEFFRTGSIKSVSRKLGNTTRVVLDHYLPKTLVASYNTRKVRRFQNLLIVAAVHNENYILEATDFNNLYELNQFIVDMLSMDVKGTNPLLSFIKDDSMINPEGELIVNISEESLTILYAYRMVADNSNLDISELSYKLPNKDISSLSIINLSKYINQVLSNHQNSNYVTTNQIAIDKAHVLSKQVKWSGFMLKKVKVQ